MKKINFNMKFLFLKKKVIFAFATSLLIVSVFFMTHCFVCAASVPKNKFSIVIDAGHGGIDGGCTGVSTGVKESDLNLKYAKKLEKSFKKAGFKVVMTRSTEEGLYSPFASNKKKSEMEKREQIIKSSNADIFISVHMNSFLSSRLSGAQVFYKKDNEWGQNLAKEITKSLKNGKINIRGECKDGDYYVLNCHNKAGVLIECGFLSNEEEEKLLGQDGYCEKFCDSVVQGVITFLKM